MKLSHHSSFAWIRYIDEEDLLRFMPKKEVDNVFPLFEGASETRKIKKSSFKKWVVSSLFCFFTKCFSPDFFMFLIVLNMTWTQKFSFFLSYPPLFFLMHFYGIATVNHVLHLCI